MSAIKIIFIGPSGVGKTTIKKIFFEQNDPIKLLKEALEPTYGVETNLYNFGTKIAVHDLAGQQFEEWISTSFDIFYESDLIITVLDATENWENNMLKWKAINDFRIKFCPDAFHGVLFHKVDLLPLTVLDELNEKIRIGFKDKEKIFAFSTSIVSEFFFEMFKKVLFLLKKSLNDKKNFKLDDLISKIIILNQFVDKNKINLEEISEIIEDQRENFRKNVEQMESDNFLIIDSNNNSIQLSEKGQNTLDSLKKKLLATISSEKLIQNQFIKAIIISDENGKLFLDYEAIPNYFRELISDETYSTDPHLISMFFSAIRDFGKTLDKDGFYEIQLSGRKFKIIILNYLKISGIFFTENEKISETSLHGLNFILENLYKTFSSEIKEFSDLSIVKNIKTVKSHIYKEISRLNDFMEKMNKSKKNIDYERLIELYQQIGNQNIDQSLIEESKNKFFRYMITEDPIDILSALQSILNGTLKK